MVVRVRREGGRGVSLCQIQLKGITGAAKEIDHFCIPPKILRHSQPPSPPIPPPKVVIAMLTKFRMFATDAHFPSFDLLTFPSSGR